MKKNKKVFLLLMFAFIANIALAQRQIVQAEYFIDTDPGQGNGTPVLPVDGNLDNAIEALFRNGITFSTTGLHTFNIRVKDDQNNWGPVFKTIVNVTSPLTIRNIHITQAEMFWDNDPGQGNGTPLIAFDGNFNDAIEAISGNISSLPSTGVHLLNIRVKDDQSNWGPVFKTIVNVTNPLALRNIKISTGEFFFDTDPGQGNGFQMLAFDGNFDSAIEQLTTSFSFLPDTGLHVLHVRSMDDSGSWGPVFRTVLRVLPCVTQPTVSITPSSTQLTCPGDTVHFSAQSGFASYTWFKGSAIVGTGQNYDATTPGFYRVYAKDANGCGVFSAFTQVVVNYFNANITASGPTTFCQGGSVILTAGSGNTSYSWNTGHTTQSITVASSGTYIVNVTNGNCIGVDTITVTVNPNPSVPVITPSGPTAFCPGGNVTLTSSPENAYAWNTNEYTQSINVSASGTYSVTVTNTHGCQATNSIVVTVYPNPINSVNGSITYCEGSTGQMSVSGGVSYSWSPATGLSSTTIANPIVYTSISTIYKVVVTGLGGCIDSANVNVIVNPVPTVTASANATNICEGSTLNLFSNPSGASSYNWIGPGGFTSSLQNPTISPVTVLNSGMYSVTVYNSANCSATHSVSIAVNQGPIAGINSNSPVCEGTSLQLNASPSGSFTYSWAGPNGFSSSQQNPIINPVSLSQAGVYAVTVSSGVCSSTANYTVVVNAGPNTSVTQTGAVLTAVQSGANYQWVDCDSSYAPIIGATQQTYTAFYNGNFAVIVVQNGCIDTSACYNVSGLGIDEFNNSSSLIIFPNPNNGQFTIQTDKEGVFELMDITGRIINTYRVNGRLDVSENLPAGMYFVRDRENKKINKLIIQ